MAKTAMIVEASASVRLAASTVLTEAGYDVLEACDGTDALRQLDGREVHLLISAKSLPDMDALSLLKQVQAMPGYRFLPVIMLTSPLSAL